MKYINIIHILLFLSIQMGCISQKLTDIPIDKQDKLLIDIYQKYFENRHDYGASFGEARDTILIRFRNTLREVLNTKEAKEYSFPLLSEKINIVHSKDKKLRIFSWDELNGGTWHIYNSVYQYYNGDTLQVGDLLFNKNNQEDFTDVSYYRIEDIADNKYLIFGYGTHGAGQEFYTIKLLHFKKAGILSCDTCFNGKDKLVLTKPRASKDKPIFDTVNKILKFPKYKENEETGVLYKTGDTIVFQYENGNFLSRNN